MPVMTNATVSFTQRGPGGTTVDNIRALVSPMASDAKVGPEGKSFEYQVVWDEPILFQPGTPDEQAISQGDYINAPEMDNGSLILDYRRTQIHYPRRSTFPTSWAVAFFNNAT